MKIKNVVGRSNLALTVFVPWDCNNACEFCTSKKMYSELSDNYHENFKKICKEISTLTRSGEIKDVVFTGGEPFASISELQYLIDRVKGKQNIYINTSFPINSCGANSKNEIVKFLERNAGKIKCLNVSRHTADLMTDETSFNTRAKFLSDSLLLKLPVPVRINAVLEYDSNDTVIERSKKIEDIIMRWYKNVNKKNFSLSLRADYRNVTQSNLKSFDEPTFVSLTEIEGLEYVGSSGCAVCNDDRFSYGGMKVSYHRGTEKSSKLIGNINIVNDIIIFPDGEVFCDWDKTGSDLEFIKDNIVVKSETVQRSRANASYEGTRKALIVGTCGMSSGSC